MLNWYLFDEGAGWCVVQEKNVMQAGSLISKGDKCRFFYLGKEYTGTVLEKSDDYEALVKIMNTLKTQDATMKKATAQKETNPLPLKRKVNPVTFYGQRTTSEEKSASGGSKKKSKKTTKPPMSEEEKTRQRILNLNRAETQRRNNALISAKAQKNNAFTPHEEDDQEWNPDLGSESEDGDESQNSDIDIQELQKLVSTDKREIVRGLKNNPNKETSSTRGAPRQENGSHNSNIDHEELREQSDNRKELERAGSNSRNKEKNGNEIEDAMAVLRRENELLQIKLQLALQTKKGNATKSADDEARSNNATNSKGGSNNSKDDSNIQKSKSNDFDFNSSRSGDNLNSFETGNEDEADKNFEQNLDRDLNEDLNLDFNDLTKNQLYGKAADTTLLCRDIFCKTDVLSLAITNAKSVETMARRLMHGVFIPSQILNCTVSGQSWHAGGAERLKQKMTPLDVTALKAISDFSNGVAKKRKWPLKKFDKLRPALSIRLNEIKNLVKSGKLSD